MKSSSGGNSKNASAGGQPAGRPPHWRRRDPTATAVYVVHPTQFRTIVQQLTGAASSPPPPVSTAHAHHQSGGGNGSSGAACGGTSNDAAAQPQPQQQHGRGEDRSSRRTLGQLHQECMAWANADDY
ncbi:hypothetical protein SEVIR_9G308200v4 [Setaria viridis]|uniref:VQ domain-containing protein n=2 Tax=Setaria TaxID=4554 RepID=K4AGM6_SETIT|nr:hypothetical protein SETIT_9G302300v2 [Setaria italica]TKV94634.1 hypothetical protein SEVIR_9G308200v2 [Setaria viridis]